MIKRKLKKWYPTKERENQVHLIDRLIEAADNLNRIRTTNSTNYILVGTDVATQLNTLYPSLTTNEAVTYVNTWCGTTIYNPSTTTTTANVNILSASTYTSLIIN